MIILRHAAPLYMGNVFKYFNFIIRIWGAGSRKTEDRSISEEDSGLRTSDSGLRTY